MLVRFVEVDDSGKTTGRQLMEIGVSCGVVMD